MIRGELVNLHATERADVPLFADWFNDQDLMISWGRSHAMRSRDSVAEAIEGWLDDERRFEHPTAFVIETLEAEPIGCLLLGLVSPIDRSAELSVFVAKPEHRSAGFGGDALDALLDAMFLQWGYHRVGIRCEAFNEPAQRFFANKGFTREGVQRDASFFDGAFHDVVLFGMIAGDWRERQGT